MKYQSKNGDQENIKHAEQMQLSELFLCQDSRSAQSRHSSINFMNFTILLSSKSVLFVCLYGNLYTGTITSTKLISEI